MRIAFYNQMFGMNGKSFFSNLLGHWAVHYQSKRERVYSKTNLERTIKIIRKANVDIVGVCEVLEGQEKELKEDLEKLGYKMVYFGEEHKTKYSGLMIKVCLASRLKLVKKEIKGFPHLDELGGGGGFLYCYVPELKTEVICLHFAIRQKKELIDKQIKFLFENLDKTKKTIILGDFNMPYQELAREFPQLNQLVLASNEMKVCSLTPILRWFHYKDDDHIFVSGFKTRKTGCLRGYSDHKLIYAELE